MRQVQLFCRTETFKDLRGELRWGRGFHYEGDFGWSFHAEFTRIDTYRDDFLSTSCWYASALGIRAASVHHLCNTGAGSIQLFTAIIVDHRLG
eukprot:jgi/Botrbrau1/18276/Bobra.0179s0010.1